MIRFEFPEDGVFQSVVLGIGVFDGVHQGHRKIIHELAAMGKATGAIPVAVTFMPHPREILGIPPLPRLLLPPEERFKRLREVGAKGIGIIDFSRQIANMPPLVFVNKLLSLSTPVRGVCVGSRWRFGRNGDGDTMFLAAEFSRRGIPFKSVPELRMDGAIVSSSLIREKIAMGDLENANAMLNARPALYGEVTHGRQLAGRVLGAPTANLTIEYGILPPNGVYATVSEVDGKRYPAVTNIGVSPTFDCSGERRIETHIIGFSGDLYCRKLTVELAAKIRDEKKFSSPSALEAQIRLDCEEAIGILSERKL